MDSKIELPKSKKAYTFRVELYTISYIILAGISVAILTVPFRIGESRFTIGSLIIVAIAILLYFLSIWMLKASWKNTRYYLTDTAIIIQRGINTSTEDVYRFDTVVSATIRQSFMGKKGGYGDIIMKVPSVEGDVELKDIDQPSGLLEKVHKKLTNNSVNPSGLLS